jgi:IS30 family transposase
VPEPYPREQNRQFWRARLRGLSVEEAAPVAGVSITCARRWVREAGGMIPDDLDRAATGRYLSLAEREEIAVGWASGLSRAEIARRIGRHRATVGRELERNGRRRAPTPPPLPPGAPPRRPGFAPGTNRGRDRPQHERLRYRAVRAQVRADHSARRPKPRRLAGNPALLDEVRAGLALCWSPEQISRTLRRSYPDQPEMWVSHETIYQELYVQGRGELRRELTRCLRSGRAVRRPRRLAGRRRARIPAEILISERPAEADDRAGPGHWEGDLIIGNQNSAIGTLVERSTRFVLLLHLPDRHGAEQVRDAMIPTIRALPQALRRSLTWDQGVEMARHGEIKTATGLPIYFCDPHSPWQRGSNENTNGLLRQYFPKGSDLSRHSAAHLAAVTAELNARPRKTLGWDSPAEAMARLLSRPVPTDVATTP